MRSRFLAVSVLAIMVISVSPLQADMVFSTHNTVTVGDQSFLHGDIGAYNLSTGAAELLFSEDEFTGGGQKQINATHLMMNGTIILSTHNKATLGGLSFERGDLVLWDPVTSSASLFFDHSLFGKKSTNIDAVYVRDNGSIVLSTTSNASLGGLSFGGSDLIEYDPLTSAAAMLWAGGDLMGLGGDINAVHILDDGDLLISTSGPTLLYGARYDSADIIRVNPMLGTADLYATGGEMFDGGGLKNINALSMTAAVPEPATIGLIAAGALLLVARRVRRI